VRRDSVQIIKLLRGMSYVELLALVLRSATDEVMVRTYADRWEAGERWPAIVISEDRRISDGYHRLAAAIMLGHAEIECWIKTTEEIQQTCNPILEARQYVDSL
jgi:hypothetical protein